MKKVILAGVDSSQASLKAAGRAAELARVYDATLHVVTAYSPSVGSSARLQAASGQSEVQAALRAQERSGERATKEAEDIASVVAEDLRAKFPSVNVASRAINGNPAEVIVAESARLNVDVVVVGNRRVQGVSRILGSIAGAVAKELKCDLYVVNTR